MSTQPPVSDQNPGPTPDPPHVYAAKAYLSSLLNKQLHIHVTDGRMFVGEFKCTDNDCNVILSRSYEYRMPSEAAKAKAAKEAEQSGVPGQKVKLDMTSRFMGMIAVPGEHIVKIEVEERSGFV